MKNQNSLKVFKTGEKVQWNWMGRKVTGIIKKMYVKPIKQEFRGTIFKRNGSLERPAYLVESLRGNKVLKSQTELTLLKK